MVKLLLVFALSFPCVVQAAINLVSNGSFENGHPNGVINYTATTTSPLSGWTYVDGYYNNFGSYVDVFNSNYYQGQASEGNWFVELVVGKNNKDGAILQTFNNLSGKYILNFDYSGMPGNDPAWGSSIFQVLWNGNVISTISPGFNPKINVDGNDVNVNNWVNYSLELDASLDVNALIFRAVTECGCTLDDIGARIDNVNLIAAVPEPETYGMLMLGLAMLGFVARRRKV